MQNTFAPNAFLAFEFMKPLRVIFPNPVQAGLVVSGIDLKWNTLKHKRFWVDYQLLLDHLGENLPQERKYRGGFFFAQIHYGKMAPWETTNTNDKAVIIYSASKKPDDICIQNLRVTVGKYAGHEMGSALINAIHLEKVFRGL